MASAYEIFKKDRDGVPVWVETAPSHEAARLRVIELDEQRSGEYMIFCHLTRQLVSSAENGNVLKLIQSSTHDNLLDFLESHLQLAVSHIQMAARSRGTGSANYLRKAREACTAITHYMKSAKLSAPELKSLKARVQKVDEQLLHLESKGNGNGHQR